MALEVLSTSTCRCGSILFEGCVSGSQDELILVGRSSVRLHRVGSTHRLWVEGPIDFEEDNPGQYRIDGAPWGPRVTLNASSIRALRAISGNSSSDELMLSMGSEPHCGSATTGSMI